MRFIFIIGAIFILLNQNAYAQVDEIIVTAVRTNNGSDSPGIFLEKKGDFLLLEVTIENDSRELSTRLKEIEHTIDNMITAAQKQPDIILNLIDENDFVRPLSMQTFTAGIRRGRRPDTSMATLKVKTNIPKAVGDSYKLARKLAVFIDGITEIGRTKIQTSDEAVVSIVNPYQYRAELVSKILADINTTKNALGSDYRVILKGMDKGIYWTRSGDLNLAFFMDYSFQIIPTTLNSYQEIIED
ncbi:MAG: hypothetical protein COA43_11740 [Robiginitomaculum sp.]|nr:MAG: hypothetical protein COA43_11740 [Robiginitomaculum sp.]